MSLKFRYNFNHVKGNLFWTLWLPAWGRTTSPTTQMTTLPLPCIKTLSLVGASSPTQRYQETTKHGTFILYHRTDGLQMQLISCIMRWTSSKAWQIIFTWRDSSTWLIAIQLGFVRSHLSPAYLQWRWARTCFQCSQHWKFKACLWKEMSLQIRTAHILRFPLALSFAQALTLQVVDFQVEAESQMELRRSLT